MTNVKVQCSFCGNTNTKFEGQYASSCFLGMGSTKVGERETINSSAGDFYRCVSCGRFFCQGCYNKLNVSKRKLGVFGNKYWTECPKCQSEVVKLS